MEQLIELLQQIQKLSGVAIDALKGASHGGGGGGEGHPDEGSPREEASEPPQEAAAEGDKPRGEAPPRRY